MINDTVIDWVWSVFSILFILAGVLSAVILICIGVAFGIKMLKNIWKG